ncbi:MAG: hypothetical protein QGI31_11220, partial [Dehalococcoidia bacterium]|nr:hypothetical protein [Dehalococcoidia bacterium]
RLTDNSAQDFWPSWSPDGSKIAFDSNPGGNAGIYVMDADGSNQVNLTNNVWGNDNAPDWGPAAP